MAAGDAVDLTRFPPLFSGDQIAAASIGTNQTGQRTVGFTLTGKGKNLFAAYTAAHIGDFFAVVLDGQIITAPLIQASIPDGQVEISQNGIGGYPLEEAQNLVAILQFGQLPFPLREIAVSGGSPAPNAGSPSTAASAPSPSGTQQPPLSISNGTSIPVTLLVNGSVVETVAPGDRQDPIAAPLPARPWTIEARSPSGRVLSTLTVAANDPIGSTFGRAVRADLSCGRLDVWSGPPLLGPTFIPGPSGDCG